MTAHAGLRPRAWARARKGASIAMAQRILLVKLSSLGDVVHTFPALSDLARAHPHATIDWAVEEAFAGLAGCTRPSPG